MAKVFGDRWKVEEGLVEAGQSWTYIVSDTQNTDATRFVLKRLKNTKRLDRFLKEFDAIRTLQHDSIVRLVEARLDLSEPFIVTEYCEGGTLADQADYLRTLSVADVIRLFLPICEAVAFAHDQNPAIFHRDIKPENVFLRRLGGPLVLGDFGLCFVEGDERVTATEEAVGSRYFIPPEMEEGRSDRVGRWTDVYSLGKLLHWMLSGKRFARENHRGNGNDIGLLRGDYFLEHVKVALDRAIVEAPQKRFESVAVFVEELRQCIRLIEGRYNPLSTAEQGCRYCGRDIYRPMKRSQIGMLFGPHASQAQAFHCLQCRVCGNVQIFYLSGDIEQQQWMRDRGLTSE